MEKYDRILTGTFEAGLHVTKGRIPLVIAVDEEDGPPLPLFSQGTDRLRRVARSKGNRASQAGPVNGITAGLALGFTAQHRVDDAKRYTGEANCHSGPADPATDLQHRLPDISQTIIIKKSSLIQGQEAGTGEPPILPPPVRNPWVERTHRFDRWEKLRESVRQ
jgi:hypothetical protein